MRDDQGLLLRVAESISDRTPVDWDAELAAHPELRQALAAFEKVALITSGAAQGSEKGLARTLDSPHAPAHLEAWGRLRILEKIGEGSFGEVFRAYDSILESEVALKLWKPSPAAGMTTDEFLDEARRLARVRHENVLRVHGADTYDGRVGMWTELVRGDTLEKLLSQRGRMGAAEASAIILPLCRALAAVHQAGLVHRDVKASNVMREDGGRVVLMDFGSGGKLPAVGQIDVSASTKGTPAAMAPEQLRGKLAGPATDIYGLGALMYRLVSGAYPVEADNLYDLVHKHATQGAVPIRDRRPDLPIEFVSVVERALEPDPKRRFQTAGAMERALAATQSLPAVALQSDPRPAAEMHPQHSITTPEAKTATRHHGRRMLLAASAVTVSVMAIAAVSLLLFRPDVEPSLQRDSALPTTSQPIHDELSAGSTGSQSLSGEPTPASDPHGGGIQSDIASEVPSGIALPAVSAKAHLFRVTPSAHERLLPGGRIEVGNAMFLEFEATEAMHVYVLNEDEAGTVYVLFPTAAFDARNPLPPGVVHRLPGTSHGQPVYWQVTSSGGREHVMVVASRQAQPALEAALSRIPQALAGRPVVYGTLGDSTVVALMRGIGGVLAREPSAHSSSPSRLSEIIDHLGGATASASDPWVWSIQLENPGR